MIDYTAPAPLSAPQPPVGAAVPAGPPMGTPLPPPPGAAPAGPNPLLLPLLASALRARAGGGAPPPAAPAGPPNGIPGATGPGAAPYPSAPTPASMKYTNETQMDGTVLLRVLNPDGSPGPVVQIVKPPTAKGGAK